MTPEEYVLDLFKHIRSAQPYDEEAVASAVLTLAVILREGRSDRQQKM